MLTVTSLLKRLLALYVHVTCVAFHPTVKFKVLFPDKHSEMISGGISVNAVPKDIVFVIKHFKRRSERDRDREWKGGAAFSVPAIIRVCLSKMNSLTTVRLHYDCE